MSDIQKIVDELWEQRISHIRLGTLLNLFSAAPDDLSEYISKHPDELKIVFSGSSEYFGR
jgi:hypothetical protein